jgi:predicted TIM-barrel fold metal-dependent hydrolase
MRIIALEEHVATPLYASKNVRVTRTSTVGDRSAKLGHDIRAELLDLGASRLAAMDAAGIDVQVLSLTMPGAQAFDAASAPAIARDANDRIREAIAAHPTRFAGFAALPTADPAAAATELDRAVRQLGFKGAMINGHTGGEFLDDKKYWAIFEAAQALRVPIYLHPREPHPAVMTAYFEGYEELATAAWGFTMDTVSHFLRMIYGGVLDAFPDLTFILGHLGEGLPFFLHRLDDHTHYSLARRGLRKTMVEYMTENVVVTCSGFFSVPALLCTVMAVGVDNVLFSVDWPYESNRLGVEFLASLPLSAGDREKIAHGNAERVLRL